MFYIILVSFTFVIIQTNAKKDKIIVEFKPGDDMEKLIKEFARINNLKYEGPVMIIFFN